MAGQPYLALDPPTFDVGCDQLRAEILELGEQCTPLRQTQLRFVASEIRGVVDEIKRALAFGLHVGDPRPDVQKPRRQQILAGGKFFLGHHRDYIRFDAMLPNFKAKTDMALVS